MHKDHKQMLKSLGANIRAARLKAGLTMPALSKLSGVNHCNISKIEVGGNITAITLYRLCWSIGIHPADVLPDYNSKSPFEPKRAAAWPNEKAQAQPPEGDRDRSQ
jgi:transcriptional regulator with XRE-family HTH domain